MINKANLRIGSIVKFNNETIEVKTGTDIDILSAEGEGIRLTDEILSALFTTREKWINMDTVYLPFTRCIFCAVRKIGLTRTSTYCFQPVVRTVNGFDYMPRVLYLHELQNWFQYHAEEELDILPYLRLNLKKQHEGEICESRTGSVCGNKKD